MNHFIPEKFGERNSTFTLPRLSLRFGLAALSLMTAALSSAQVVIEQCTDRALPGEAINVTADGLTGTVGVKIAVVGSNGVVGPYQSCTILGQNANVVQAQVPMTLAKGLWSVVATSSSGTSAPAYVNRAEVYFFDNAQASPGSTLNIYGRNLQLLGTTTQGTVTFVPPSGPALSAPIEKASTFDYTVEVPANAVPGETYTVQVSNGYGGSLGEVSAPTTFPVTAAGTDSYQLGLWWGKQFTFSSNVYNAVTDTRLKQHVVGDGVTNDEAAVQADLIQISDAGGGVLYFPAGKYLIGGSSTLHIYGNEVLAGEASATTTLVYGQNYSPSNVPPTTYAIQANGVSKIGFYNLTIQNANTSTYETSGLCIGYPGSGVDRVFFKNCNLLLGNDVGLRAYEATNFCMEGCRMQNLSIHYPAIELGGTMYLTYTGNMVVWRNSRNGFNCTSNAVVQNNVFSRDNTFMTANAVETGGIEFSGSRLTYFNNNTVQGIGPFPVRVGCGEMINIQTGGFTDEQDLGKVTSATPTTLTDSTQSWTSGGLGNFMMPYTSLFNRSMVAIIKGKGMGQYRFITSNTRQTLTLSAPWTVVPDSTSVYTVGFWASDHQLFVGNTFSNSNTNIEFWNGAIDSVADSNTSTNCGDLILRSMDQTLDTGNIHHEHDLCWGNWLSNNTVTDTSGNVPATIVAYACNADGNVNGNNLLDTEIRSNTVTAHTPNVIIPAEWGSSEAYYVDIVVYKAGYKDPFSNIGPRVLYNKSNNISSPFQVTSCGLVQLLTSAPVAP